MATPHDPGIVDEINTEICRAARELRCMGVPSRFAADMAFDLVVATMAREAPCALAIYRAAIIRRYPAIFDHLN